MRYDDERRYNVNTTNCTSLFPTNASIKYTMKFPYIFLLISEPIKYVWFSNWKSQCRTKNERFIVELCACNSLTWWTKELIKNAADCWCVIYLTELNE